jgi:hypothetical protein
MLFCHIDSFGFIAKIIPIIFDIMHIMKILLQIMALFIFNSCAKEVELPKEKLPNIDNFFEAVWSEAAKDALKSKKMQKELFHHPKFKGNLN